MGYNGSHYLDFKSAVKSNELWKQNLDYSLALCEEPSVDIDSFDWRRIASWLRTSGAAAYGRPDLNTGPGLWESQ